MTHRPPLPHGAAGDVVVRPAGWYLGLRYMQGTGLAARAAERVEASRRGAQFIFADRVLLGAAENWRDILSDWWEALAADGHLILWLPDCRHHALEPHEARVTLEDIRHALDERGGWQLREADLIDGHAYVVWQKRRDERQLAMPWRKQTKHLLIVRTGAHGDALMAASVLPYLKEQGWTISFITRAAGIETLRHDPHIDELILLSPGHVSDDELPFYWQAWEKRFDRFINLTHSVEGELLKQPWRQDYFWPAAQRRIACARSYLGHTHELAEVPGPYRVRFYPSAEEKEWAASRARAYGKFVLWCLRGSAIHKWWPHGSQAICQLLARTDLNFVLTGDAESAPLAEEIMAAARGYHGDASRVHVLAGTHSIRAIMTLAHHAAAVVGPETGVMNAVSLQAVPKILLLSHSAPRNLSDDWIATTALVPRAPCYPCHRLHFAPDWCVPDAATGAAACAASIRVDEMLHAVTSAAKQNATPWWKASEISCAA